MFRPRWSRLGNTLRVLFGTLLTALLFSALRSNWPLSARAPVVGSTWIT